MSPKSYAEWQVIAALLAQGVMGWSHDEEFWVTPNDPLMVMYIIEAADTFAERTGCPVDRDCVWFPPTSITQAREVLQAILDQSGLNCEAYIIVRHSSRQCTVTIHNWVTSTNSRAYFVRSYADTVERAICLVAIEWLNTRGKQL